MELVSLMQYTFLASVAFDLAVGVWFYNNSRHLHSPVVKIYLVNLFFSIGWEIVMYISFFIQRGALFNFFFNASTFAFGVAGMFTTLWLLWIFFDRQYLKAFHIRITLIITTFFVVMSYIPEFIVGEKIYDSESSLFYLANARFTIPLYTAVLFQLTLLIILLAFGYMRSIGRKKEQAKLLVFAFGLNTLIAVSANVVIPLIAKTFWAGYSHSEVLAVSIPQVVSGICVSIISAVIAYAILRYRIFSIRYHIRRFALLICLCFLVEIIIVIILYFLLVSQFTNYFLILLILSSVMLILFWPIKKCAEIVVHYFIPQTQVDLYELTADEQKILDSIPTLDAFVRLAVDHFMTRMPVEFIAIYTYNKHIGSFQSVYPHNRSKIAEDEGWFMEFQKSNFFVSQTVKNHFHCQNIFPIIYNNQLISLLCLSDRINHKNYTIEDKMFINEFCKFLSFNLWNCLYLQNQVYEHNHTS